MKKIKNTIGNVALFNLLPQYQGIKKEIDAAIKRVLESGYYILGKEVENFETQFTKYIGTKYAIGLASGTDALTIALKSLELKPDDEVVVPANVYPTIFGVAQSGVRIKLADVNPETFTLDVKSIEKVVTKKTKAIVVVHLYGNPADLASLKAFAKKKKLYLIEDCAQSAGATYRGRKVGSFGDLACFSFYPTKNLGTYGDGGAVLTNNKKLFTKARLLRMYGEEGRYNSVLIGQNSRLDELHAAILSTKLKYLSKWNKARRKLAKLYLKGLKGLPVVFPVELKNAEHVYHLFTIQTPERDKLANFLKSKGILTGVHYPVTIHQTPSFAYLKNKPGDFPISEKLSKETLSLPLYPELDESSVQFVVDNIKAYILQK